MYLMGFLKRAEVVVLKNRSETNHKMEEAAQYSIISLLYGFLTLSAGIHFPPKCFFERRKASERQAKEENKSHHHS